SLRELRADDHTSTVTADVSGHSRPSGGGRRPYCCCAWSEMAEFRSAAANPCCIRCGSVDHNYFFAVAEREGPIPIRDVEQSLGYTVLRTGFLPRQPLGNRGNRTGMAVSIPLCRNTAFLPYVQAGRLILTRVYRVSTSGFEWIIDHGHLPVDLEKCSPAACTLLTAAD